MKLRGEVRAILLGLRQRATPHPALRATFPSNLGKASPDDLRFVNAANHVLSGLIPALLPNGTRGSRGSALCYIASRRRRSRMRVAVRGRRLVRAPLRHLRFARQGDTFEACCTNVAGAAADLIEGESDGDSEIQIEIIAHASVRASPREGPPQSGPIQVERGGPPLLPFGRRACHRARPGGGAERRMKAPSPSDYAPSGAAWANLPRLHPHPLPFSRTGEGGAQATSARRRQGA